MVGFLRSHCTLLSPSVLICTREEWFLPSKSVSQITDNTCETWNRSVVSDGDGVGTRSCRAVRSRLMSLGFILRAVGSHGSRGWQRGEACSGGTVERGKRQRNQGAAMRPELRQWLEKGEEGTDSRASLELAHSREAVSCSPLCCRRQGLRALCPTLTT